MKTLQFLFIAISSVILNINGYSQGTKVNTECLWRIKSMLISGKQETLTLKEASVLINTKDKTLTAYIGCNRITGNFEFVTGDMIKPIVLAYTRKGCKGNLSELESNLTGILEKTNSIRKNGAKIEFYKDAELLMVLERPADKKK